MFFIYFPWTYFFFFFVLAILVCVASFIHLFISPKSSLSQDLSYLLDEGNWQSSVQVVSGNVAVDEQNVTTDDDDVPGPGAEIFADEGIPHVPTSSTAPSSVCTPLPTPKVFVL